MRQKWQLLSCLTEISQFFSENRYLLILTENYAALPIMQQHLLKTADDAVVIFGSSFPNDQEYTQVNSIDVK